MIINKQKRIKEYSKKYYELNKEKLKEKSRIFRLNNKKIIKTYFCLNCNLSFESRKNNKKFCNRDCQIKYWFKNNKSKVNLNIKKYSKTSKGKISNVKKYKKYKINNPLKYNANIKIMHDKIKNPNKYKNYCEKCFKTNCKIEQHHENYNEPYEVIALCSSCHKKRHIELKNVFL